jgi:hypothetical protein
MLTVVVPPGSAQASSSAQQCCPIIWQIAIHTHVIAHISGLEQSWLLDVLVSCVVLSLFVAVSVSPLPVVVNLDYQLVL